MAIADYIASLKETRTYKAGLIRHQEYSISSRFGFVPVLPKIPSADDDRHVVVMKIVGDQPNLFTVLADPKHSISLTAKDLDKLLFIFIEMRPQSLKVEPPAEGYHLGDGHRVGVSLKVTYQVVDAETFWRGGRDQLAEFEATIIDAAKNFFLTISSNFLISSPSELKQAAERHIQETGIKAVKDDLEKSIGTHCEVAGIKLLKVGADVSLSDALREHLQRIHASIYGERGLVERWKIDKLIDMDATYRPYGLRTVINSVDIRLIENFYNMKWSDAMRTVTERLAEKREEYLRSVQETEIGKMKMLIETAEHVGLDDMDITDLKAQFAANLKVIAGRDSRSHPTSDAQYLRLILEAPSTGGLLGSDGSSSGAADDKGS